jgi:hypothetical protein
MYAGTAPSASKTEQSGVRYIPVPMKKH